MNDDKPTPKHTYETTQGTKPTPHGQHEPRLVAHTVTTGDDTDLHMMSEIGDGVFVSWTNCRRCSKRVYDCKCEGGPVEPHYMKPWRDKRFERELTTRPEPSYTLLPTIIEWVKERGYRVTKERTTKAEVDDAAQEEALLDAKPQCELCGTPTSERDKHGTIMCADCQGGDDLDEGLDRALSAVREARDSDVGF